jgi:hypothetical protein
MIGGGDLQSCGGAAQVKAPNDGHEHHRSSQRPGEASSGTPTGQPRSLDSSLKFAGRANRAQMTLQYRTKPCLVYVRFIHQFLLARLEDALAGVPAPCEHDSNATQPCPPNSQESPLSIRMTSLPCIATRRPSAARAITCQPRSGRFSPLRYAAIYATRSRRERSAH